MSRFGTRDPFFDALDQREHDDRVDRVVKATEERLAEYAKLIEERWRGLSDGERLTLMGLCCRDCGAITAAKDGVPAKPCWCGR